IPHLFLCFNSINTPPKITVCYNNLLISAYEQMKNNEFDMPIIDKFFTAYEKNLISKEIAEKLVFEKGKKCEIILT
ncbi:MAG: hypothetical protein K2H19_05095, partial [Ruminococcus sp.]|nr:hypothetical protein [Ruminococcus sp.]